MDSKDFKKMIEKKLKETFSNIQSNYCASQRNSRPRVKNNILQPEQVKDHNHCVVHDDQDYK
jgi:hypothetical protein